VPRTLVGASLEEVLLVGEHVERRFDGGKIGFEVAVGLVEPPIDQPPDQRGARDSLCSGSLVERAGLPLVELDVCPVHTSDYTPLTDLRPAMLLHEPANIGADQRSTRPRGTA
jgi:hypothetical protein